MTKTRAEVNSFYHGSVDMGSGNSADYVVAHAARQRHKGKNLSVPYKDITNPELAREAAQKDIDARTARSFEDGTPFYTADYSGRVAVLHAKNDGRQKEYAAMFVDARMRDGRCVGAVILGDFEEVVGDIDPTQVNPNGTVDVPYLFAP
ncbi:MAG TPA: hypothetical protein VLE69_04240 [Candidatus Saccharimonadales bacterium]|nr:hypothetical protein [Candidatus Saccharimonadales bacterium]